MGFINKKVPQKTRLVEGNMFPTPTVQPAGKQQQKMSVQVEDRETKQ